MYGVLTGYDGWHVWSTNGVWACVGLLVGGVAHANGYLVPLIFQGVVHMSCGVRACVCLVARDVAVQSNQSVGLLCLCLR